MGGVSLSLLLSNLVGLFILIGVGFGVVRAGIVPESASGPLTSLLMKITLPCTIFVSMLRPFDARFLRDSLLIILVGLIAFPLLGLLSWLLVRPLKVKKGSRGMWMLCCTFCNNGFMGFPVAYSLFGEEGMALAVMLGIPFNLYIYTWGARLVMMDRAGSSGERMPSLRKTLLTAINGATLLGLVFYCLQLSLPEAILSPVRQLSNLTTPLSMMVTGMKLAGGRIQDVIRDRDVCTASLVRLLLFPGVCWLALKPIPFPNPMVAEVTLIILAMPAPAAATILGQQYQGNAELGARVVFLSSLLCIVTLPLVALLL